MITSLFDGFNTYLGNYIGEFLGELGVSTFFLLSAWALLRSRTVPRLVPVVGLAAAAAGYVGMFRNVSPAVAPVAMANNYLLPLWMITFGVVLMRHRSPSTPA